MAKGDTKTEDLMDILANGGDASKYADRKGNTKLQNYILDAIEHGSGGGGGGAISGSGAPTEKTVGELGQVYVDTDTGSVYILSKIEDGSYLWEEFIEGEAPDTQKYAELSYYTVWSTDWSLSYQSDCSVEIADIDKLQSWAEQHPVTEWESQFYPFESFDGEVWYWMGGYQTIRFSAEELKEQTGIEIISAEPSMWMGCSFAIQGTFIVDKDSPTATIDIIGRKQWDALGIEDSQLNIEKVGPNKIDIPKGVVKSVIYNQDVVTYYPDNFLMLCKNLETYEGSTYSHEWGSNSIVSVGDNFMYQCTGLVANGTVSFSNTMTEGAAKIGNNFLAQAEIKNCTEFHVWCYSAEVGDNFLQSFKFGGKSWIGVKSFGKNFCAGCDAEMISLEFGAALNEMEEIPDGFCSSCPNLKYFADYDYVADNWGLTINAKKIGDSFCSGVSFETGHKPILNFPNAVEIGSYFLSGSVFDGLILAPSLEKIGWDFLNNCGRFNSALDLPMLKEVDGRFLCGCSSFTRSLDLPSLQKIWSCMDFLSETPITSLTIGQSNLWVSTDFRDEALVTRNESSPTYVNGIAILGPGRNSILNALPNKDTSPYRKLYDAGGENFVDSGLAAPTTDMVGSKGQLYVDISTAKLYICTSADSTAGKYTWSEIGG